MRILIVEDEPTLREGLTDLLEAAGHQVRAVADGRDAVRPGSTAAADLVVLDLMLPGLDGIEVCRQLRQTCPQLGILMLTARGAEEDKVAGLDAGADDYLTKPFGARELLARVEAVGRRRQPSAPGPELLSAAGWTFDLGRCRARRDGADVELTAREAGILRILWLHRDRAVSRAELLERVWESRGDLETRAVDMAIVKLRQKIEPDPARPQLVVTVKGIGYAWGAA